MVVVQSAAKQESRAARMLREVYESGRPITFIRTTEEHRIERVLLEGTLPVWTWTLTEGFRNVPGHGAVAVLVRDTGRAVRVIAGRFAAPRAIDGHAVTVPV